MKWFISCGAAFGSFSSPSIQTNKNVQKGVDYLGKVIVNEVRRRSKSLIVHMPNILNREHEEEIT